MSRYSSYARIVTMKWCRKPSSGLKSLQRYVYDGSWRKDSASGSRKGSERDSHCGATPLMTCSDSGTRNMDCAFCWCRASQATTSLAESAATSTSSPRTATHWPMNGCSASASDGGAAALAPAGSGVAVAEPSGWRFLRCAARAAVNPRRVRARRAWHDTGDTTRRREVVALGDDLTGWPLSGPLACSRLAGCPEWLRGPDTVPATGAAWPRCRPRSASGSRTVSGHSPWRN